MRALVALDRIVTGLPMFKRVLDKGCKQEGAA